MRTITTARDVWTRRHAYEDWYGVAVSKSEPGAERQRNVSATRSSDSSAHAVAHRF